MNPILLVAPFAGAWIETKCPQYYTPDDKSLPSRERGLKLGHVLNPNAPTVSLPSRERGLKQMSLHPMPQRPVAPFAGAWIETDLARANKGGALVAPFAGAWIETRSLAGCIHGSAVAPFAGAWIETGCNAKSPITLIVAPSAGAWIETAWRFAVAR